MANLLHALARLLPLRSDVHIVGPNEKSDFDVGAVLIQKADEDGTVSEVEFKGIPCFGEVGGRYLALMRDDAGDVVCRIVEPEPRNPMQVIHQKNNGLLTLHAYTLTPENTVKSAAPKAKKETK